MANVDLDAYGAAYRSLLEDERTKVEAALNEARAQNADSIQFERMTEEPRKWDVTDLKAYLSVLEQRLNTFDS